MAYFKPYIDETGLHMPLYQDVLDEINNSCKRIFGNDIYLEPDSQDYQANAEVADLWADVASLCQMVYNNRSTQFSKGAALDGLLKINGLKRLKASNSIVVLTCKGTPGTSIKNAMVSDQAGEVNWLLEDTVITDSGSIDVYAICETPGEIYADAGTLVQIVTQTRGWESVTNKASAIPGKAIETDAAAKARQSLSTAKPGKTVLLGLTGGIAEVSGVLRYKIYENDTGEIDENGIPEHSVCCVVEGGDPDDIAKEIWLRKTPGCGTFGNIAVNVETPNPILNNPPPIHFFRPAYIDVYVKINIKRRTGYVDAMEKQIKERVAGFINSLIEAIAQSIVPNMRSPAFTLSASVPVIVGTDGNILAETDVEIAFNQAARCSINNVKVAFE